MHDNDIKQRLVKCFSTVFPDLTEEEIYRANQASVASWDSVASITLVSVVEEEFETQIDFEAVADLVSFDLVLDYLSQRNVASASSL
jgi:acyl carrier protein